MTRAAVLALLLFIVIAACVAATKHLDRKDPR